MMAGAGAVRGDQHEGTRVRYDRPHRPGGNAGDRRAVGVVGDEHLGVAPQGDPFQAVGKADAELGFGPWKGERRAVRIAGGGAEERRGRGEDAPGRPHVSATARKS